jgi:hypothetical protein
MRLTMLSLFPIVAALLGETQASSAQSAHSYSWSSKSQTAGSVACRFSSSTGAIASKAPTTERRPPRRRFSLGAIVLNGT